MSTFTFRKYDMKVYVYGVCVCGRKRESERAPHIYFK